MTALPTEVVSEFVKRIASEFYANRMYSAMAVVFERDGYMIAAQWAKNEAADEAVHAQGIIDFLSDYNANFTLPATPTFDTGAMTFSECISTITKAESDLQDDYNAMYSQFEESNPTVANFILKYIAIQDDSVRFMLNVENAIKGVEEKCDLLLLQKQLFKK